MTSKVGIVVPTLGTRPKYLSQCLESIRLAGDAHIAVVAPETFNASKYLSLGLIDQQVIDPKEGLPVAINAGISALPGGIQFVNWLGDDDLLTKDSLTKAEAVLNSQPKTVMVYGSCDYIDDSGEVIWKNSSGVWAAKILRFGPDLIPQPGALIRRYAFEAVGGLSQEYDWAFDFDLLIKLSKIGKLTFINQTLASFRWHPTSLSVEFRQISVAEASKVRMSHLPAFLRPISCVWEYPVRQATLIAGNRVSAKARKKAKS